MTLVLLEYMTFGPIFDEAIYTEFSVLLYTFICFDKVPLIEEECKEKDKEYDNLYLDMKGREKE